MKTDSHSTIGRYRILVLALTGMMTWIPDQVGNDMGHFHLSLFAAGI